MEYELKMWCSKCGCKMADNEDIFCLDCVKELKDKVKELEDVNYKLEVKVKKFEEEREEIKEGKCNYFIRNGNWGERIFLSVS